MLASPAAGFALARPAPPGHARAIDPDLEIREDAHELRIRQGSRTPAWAALLLVAFAAFVLWQTVAYGGVRFPRSYIRSGAVAGYVLAGCFLAVAAGGAAITGWIEWLRIDRRTRELTRSVGGVFPWWRWRRATAELFRVQVRETLHPDGPWQFDVWLEGRGRTVRVATVRTREGAEEVAGRVARFLAIAGADHATRRVAEKAAAAAAKRPPAEFSLVREGRRATLRVGGRQAEWDAGEFPRAVLFVLTPARSGGEIQLIAFAPDDRRQVLLAWGAYDAEIDATLREHEAELRAVFASGFEIQAAADA